MKYIDHLNFLDNREESMLTLLKKLVNINSHTENLDGIRLVQQTILSHAQGLGCQSTWIKTPPHTLLKLKKRPKAPFQILLVGHADTVYRKESHFQRFRVLEQTVFGPGVADMKGGLVILLHVLEALERSPLKENIGWTVLINGDEESGSIGSSPIIKNEAYGKDCALVFEPAKDKGAYVKRRPFSANYLFIAQGRKAHAGRDFYKGVNAITPLAHIASELSGLSSKLKQIQVNIASIQGGSAFNIVPDACSLGVNVRVFDNKTALNVKTAIDGILKKYPTVKMQTLCERPALEITPIQKQFHSLLRKAGTLLGEKISFTESGGVTDGNVIASLGIPTIDSMGIIGKGLHTEKEEADITSLVPRAKLAALLIMLKAESYV